MRRLFLSETISTGSVGSVRGLAMAGVLLVLIGNCLYRPMNGVTKTSGSRVIRSGCLKPAR